ncbi:thioredoxin domain-containing protein [Actinomadura madurae]|uniref:thioredoxin domain-containing protein n=1 Tax=Actinomadura madurae TaxID=1993 RepID=UPI0020273425|nr:thioredoxin domain-containing protein [Actinomadura madurae]URN01603.1 thioredoxin domain-containing protein [Actinomadura madurae]URN10702.1 thioredoxin domain-containing protein [Actinomadura madurae]
MNRLKDATSPYLLQHAGNPVDWWEWSDEAFVEARRRDVPVLLSVGYAACHWCHVMAHESFEDGETARVMNELFVNIKVDREERPDIDAVYMEATQAMTGQGGWPMTVFMTPEGHPFYCGTYFPRVQFRALLQAVHKAWAEQRDEVVGQGQQVVTALTSRGGGPVGAEAPGEGVLAHAVKALGASYDAVRGGFGGAPKFPPSMALEFLLRHHARTGDDEALAMASHTLEAMARGGMYDQLGGGFARYSVDAKWVVPHFEKMLYDNALLARVYAHWWRLTGTPFARRVALETCDWMLRDLRTDQGGLASALDADSEGVEGKYYVWTPAQLREVLGDEDGAFAESLFEVTGTFEHGSSVLQLLNDPEGVERYERVRTALLSARAHRIPPARDDKVVAAWNGLAIAALAECGALLDRPDLVRAAEEVARLLVDVHVRDGRLVRTSKDGTAGANAGVLEDYADVAEGLLALHAVTGDPRHVRLAGALLDTVLERFGDGEGGFYDTADDAERLFRRPQDPTDNATPSGQFAAAGALLSFSALTGSDRHREAARAALGPAGALADRHARFAGWGLAVAEASATGPVEIAVIGDPDDDRTRALHRTALMASVPGAVVSTGPPDAGGVPLLEGRGLVEDRPAAYVCRNFTCRLPVTTPADLTRELRGQLD